MEYSAFFKQNVYPSIYAGQIEKLIKLNQELFITNKWFEHLSEDNEQHEELYAKLQSLQNEIKTIRQEMADFQSEVCNSRSIESEIYWEILSKLDATNQTNHHLFAEINNLIQEQEKVLNQLPLLNFTQQKQEERLKVFEEWTKGIDNKILNQTEINEIIKEQLTNHSSILNELLELCSKNTTEALEDLTDRSKDDQSEEDVDCGKASVKESTSNFSRFFETLPANYPIAFLIAQGSKIPVTKFIKYDTEKQIVQCINDRTEVNIDCGVVDGVIFRPLCE